MPVFIARRMIGTDEVILYYNLIINYLQRNTFQVIRNEDTSLKLPCRFFGIVQFPGIQRFILGVIKYQVLHLQPFGQASRIHGRTVMLLVRLEAVAVGIQAESLTWRRKLLGLMNHN